MYNSTTYNYYLQNLVRSLKNNVKEKRTIFQSVKKDFYKGFKRLYWFLYTRIFYYFLSTLFKVKKKEIKEYKISLICPSRERVLKFSRMVNSLFQKVYKIENIEMLVLLDRNDKEIDLYKKEINNMNNRGLNTKIFIIDLLNNAKRINYLVKKSKGDVFFAINDDLIFKSDNWDYYINFEFSKINMNRPFCLWITSDVKYNYLHCEFPIINRCWYDILGYHSTEHFSHWNLDTWICDLSHRSKKFIVSNLIEVEQLSANRFSDEIDNTHLVNLAKQKLNNDSEIWKETKKIRIDESIKLKSK